MSALEREVNGDGTATVNGFGRDWTVPTRQRLSHKLGLQAGLNSRYPDEDLLICQVFLGQQQFAELLGIDPEASELDDFATRIAQAVGLGDKGNS